MTLTGLIDVHHHIVPPGYREAIDRATDGSVGGIPQPPWDEQQMLDRIDAMGVDGVLVSISAPALAPIAAHARPELARTCNDAIAALAARHPGTVGGFAVLPMPDVPASLAELSRALDVLRLDGVSVLTNYDGRYLGDERFAPLLHELDRRAAIVHVHPNLPPAMPTARLHLPPPVVEFTFDTTRMIADLIISETLRRYDRLTLILSHLGGTLPWVAWRLSMLDDLPSTFDRQQRRRTVREQLRRLYYDVAISAAPETLRLAAEVVGTDRLLFGSDMPFAPPGFITRNTAHLTTPINGTPVTDAIRTNTARLQLRMLDKR